MIEGMVVVMAYRAIVWNARTFTNPLLGKGALARYSQREGHSQDAASGDGQ